MIAEDTRCKTQDAGHEVFARCRLFFSSGEHGLSLIAVMWIVTILTIMASEFMYSVNLEVRISSNWNDQVKAYYAAKGGFETAIIVLKEDKNPEDETEAEEPEYDSLDEDWAQAITGDLNDGTYETTIVDESSKINVNTADEDTLTNAIAYCIKTSNTDNEMADEEMLVNAQTLAAAVIESRPYRTVAEMAKANNMTPEILYGESDQGTNTSQRTNTSAASATSVYEESTDQQQQLVPLVDITTVYSAEKNVTSDGSARVNINSADAGQIQQGINPQGQQIITQQEAQAIVDYRDEIGNNQQGQGGGQQGQAGMSAQSGTFAQGITSGQEGATQQQSGYTGIGQLLDVPAISQQTFNSIRNSLTTQDQDNGGGGNRNMVNINTADSNTLQSLDGIDSGIAESIINYRNQNQFDNIDEIREVKAISIQDMRTIADRVTISDEDAVQGKVNINTASLEVLQMLPGMDEEKAQAIIDRRTLATSSSMVLVQQQGDQATGPFTGIGELMDVQGIDENTFKGLLDDVSCRSAAYMITSEGRSADEKIIQVCKGVVDLSGDKVEIKYWKQD